MTRLAAAVGILLISALLPLAAQQVVVPGRADRVTPLHADIGDSVVAAVHDDYRLPDGRLQWLWRFRLHDWQLTDGRHELTVRVEGDVPVQLAMYRIENRTDSETLIDRQDLGSAVSTAGGDRQATLTRAGSYVLSVTTTGPDPAREGRIHVGIGAPARAPSALRPETQKPIPAKPPISRDAFFRNLALSGTQARFGDHVSIMPTMTDLPPGCGQWQWASVDVQGLLPPGLRLTPNSAKIEGTPRRVGTWTFTYTLRGLSCTGSSTVYGDRSISVTFTVLP